MAPNENGSEFARNREYTIPPEFITEKGSFRQYKRDLERWARCTSVPKKNQADIILLHIPKHHPMKERLDDEIGTEIVDNERGMELLIKTLETIYGADEVLESYFRFRDLELKQRSVGQDILEYISEWESLYLRAKDKGVTLQENVKAFKLLMSTNLDEIDMKLVLSEMDMKSEAGKKILFDQAKTAIRKYNAAGTLQTHKATSKTLFSDLQMSKIEETFISKGWTRPDDAAKRSKKRKPEENDAKKTKREIGFDKDGNW